jgi:hypothetical protein
VVDAKSPISVDCAASGVRSRTHSSRRSPASRSRRARTPSLRKGGGLVVAPGRGLVGANTENPH